MQCFTLTGGMDPNLKVDVTTERFGEDTIRVRASTQVCADTLPPDLIS